MKNVSRLYKILFFVPVTAVAFLASTVYRPYIYENNIDDFHLADSLPSFFSVIATYSLIDLYYTIRKKPFNKRFTLIALLVGGLIYESLQLLTGGFDWYDMLALLLGFAAVLLFIILLEKRRRIGA